MKYIGIVIANIAFMCQLLSDNITDFRLANLWGGECGFICGPSRSCARASFPQCTVSESGTCSGSSVVSGVEASHYYRVCVPGSLTDDCTNNRGYCPGGKYVCSWIPYQYPSRICEPLYESTGNYLITGCE